MQVVPSPSPPPLSYESSVLAKEKIHIKKLHSVVDLLQEIFRDFSELLLLKTSIFDRQFDYFANVSKFHPVCTYVLQ